MDNYVLEMKNISMEFPGVKALSNVDFTIKSGEVKAVVGANGAGKSTLMKVLAGVNEKYTGDIYINGERCDIRNPRAAKELGIEIVYQEVDTALFSYLSVAENIMFNSIVTGMKGKSFINWVNVKKSAKEIIDQLKIKVDVNQQVGTLTLAQKQMVLIARAVREHCRFLILDEPTAPLSMSEIDELFRIVKKLSSDNVGVIFISHRLPELFRICKNITIMRDGRVVKDMYLDDSVKLQNIVDLMLGRSFEENFPKRIVPIGDIAFEVNGLSDTEGKVKNVSFYVKRGEIVGICGLVGAGKTELSKVLFGASKKSSGTIFYKGKELRLGSPTFAVRQGIGLIPEERRKEGVLVDEPVYFNLSASNLGKFCGKFSFVDRKSELSSAREYIHKLGIKATSEFEKVKFLSGGNQQKVAVGKWLASDSDVFIMDEPMKGVDGGAKHDIFELIETLAEAGKLVLYLSSEIAEILAITDRTYVMYSGEITAELETAKTKEEEILYYSTGGRKNEQCVVNG